MRKVKRQPHLPPALFISLRVWRNHSRLVAVLLLTAFALLTYYLASPTSSQAASATIQISEVEFDPAGTDSGHEWFELVNVSNAPVTITGWTVTDNTSSDTIPTTTIPSQGYVVVAENSTNFLADHPGFSGTVVNLGSAIGNGLAVNDVLTLKDNSSITIDCVSWGTDVTCLSPSVTAPSPADSTQTIQRISRFDSDTNRDWSSATETPGTPLNGGAIAYDSTGAAGRFDSVAIGGTLSWSHTVAAGSNRLIVVGVSTSNNLVLDPDSRVTSVTFNEMTVPRIGTGILTGNGTGVEVSPDNLNGVEMFALVLGSGASISANVEVTYSTGVSYIVGGSSSFFNVNQTTPTGTFTRNEGTDSSPIVSVTSALNEVVIDTVVISPAALALLAGPGQAERWNGLTLIDSNPDTPEFDPGSFSVGAGSTEAGASSVQMSWTSTNSGNWAIGAVTLKPFSPTLVQLSSFTATQSRHGIALRWQTGYEVDNLGFNLYREVRGRRTRVTPSMVAGSALLAGQSVALTAGRSYAWTDTKGTADAQYWLEDVDLNGRRTLHGPIVPGASSSSGRAVSEESQSPMLDQLNSMTLGGGNTSLVQVGYPASFDSQAVQGSGKGTSLSISKESAQGSADVTGGTPQEQQRAIAAQAAVKLLVNHKGWYRVGQQELVAAGLNANVDPRLLQLYAEGLEVPILVNSSTGSQFGPGDSIEFYGQGLETPWTDTQVYWLVAGQTQGARIRKQKVRSLERPTINQPNQPGQSGQPANSPGSASQPATTTGTGATQPSRTFANWLPALSLPSLTLERESPASGATATPPLSLADKPVARVSKPEVEVMSDATRAALRSTSSATPALKIEAAEPPPAAVAPPTNIAQPVKRTETTASALPSTTPRKSNKQKRRKRKARVKSGSKASASRHQLRSHATTASGMSDVAESFNYTIERTERTLYFAALQNGDEDNFFGQLIGQQPATLKLNIQHLASSAGQSTLEIKLQGVTTQAHRVGVRLNGTIVGEISFTERARPATQFQVSNALLHEGENTLILTALLGETDLSLVDRVRVTYPHTYEAENNSLAFNVDGRVGVSVGGFNSSSIRLLDISNPEAPEELVVQAETQGAGYGVAFEAAQGGTLLAMTNGQIERPAQVTSNQPSSWHKYEPGADLLIVTHRSFTNALAPLVALRQSQGLTAAVVDVEDIYDEFSYGAHSTPAVREFLSWTKGHWQRAPRYVLLVGDCSLDPHNYLGQGQADYVPTKLVDTTQLETASDDSLADFNSDGIPEMAVGRLPVRTAEEATALVGKIVSFQNGNLKRGALLVSDHKDGYDFEAANQEVRALLPAGMDVQIINRGTSDASTVRSQIVNAVNQGPLLVNYLGHGSVEQWAGAGILRTADAASLTNAQSLSFFVTMTCLNGFAQDVYSQSLAEALLRSSQGGAVAVWASSGLTGPDQQALMNKQLVRSLFGDQPATIGDAVISAKAATQNMDTRRTWMLFGDPTTRLR